MSAAGLNHHVVDGVEQVSYHGTLEGDRAVTADLPLPGYAFGMLHTAMQAGSNHLTMLPFSCCPPFLGTMPQQQGAAAAQVGVRLCSYFEITLAPLPEAEAGFAPPIGPCVALGVGSARFPLLGRMPGWDAQSYGWHSDDGKRFHRSGVGHTFGPAYGAGDTVGCGIDFSACVPRSYGAPHQLRRGSIFYTLNGRFVGYAFHGVDVSEPLWPLVGIDTPYPVSFNFGVTSPFAFDVHALESQLWAKTAPRRASTSSALCTPEQHHGHRRNSSGGSIADASHVQAVELSLRHALASARRMRKGARSSSHKAALQRKVRDAHLASGDINRDIGALRAPVLFPVSGSTAYDRCLAVHALQWRLVDSQPVPMSDVLLSWMLRNLRRQRLGVLPASTPPVDDSQQAEGGGDAGETRPALHLSAPNQQTSTQDDWDDAVTHMVHAMCIELPGQYRPSSDPSTAPSSLSFVPRTSSRLRTPRAHFSPTNGTQTPGVDIFDGDHSWWSDGSEHLELMDGAQISIMSAAGTRETQSASVPHIQSQLPSEQVQSTAHAAAIPRRFGLSHLQNRDPLSAGSERTAPRQPTQEISLAEGLRAPVRCSFD